MKQNLLIFATIIIIVSILLSSCSITKRRYTDGYYVSHNSCKQAETKVQEQAAQKKTKQSLYAVQNTNEKTNLDYDSRQNLVIENGSITANNKQVIINPNTIKATKHYINYTATVIPKASNTLFHTKKITTETVAGDVLSLFWIVILILVILWLIALLTGGWGLGGFIYLLLVVALILLILWLLRII